MPFLNSRHFPEMVYGLLCFAEEVPMLHVHPGQCGLCTHFGEPHNGHKASLAQIRLKQEAPDTLVDECGHPRLVSLHLKVTPLSGCDGFQQAKPS
jgi:hypothetical protein